MGDTVHCDGRMFDAEGQSCGSTAESGQEADTFSICSSALSQGDDKGTLKVWFSFPFTLLPEHE